MIPGERGNYLLSRHFKSWKIVGKYFDKFIYGRIYFIE